jgi:hypothetical protein
VLGTEEKGMENCKNRSKENNCFIEIEYTIENMILFVESLTLDETSLNLQVGFVGLS